MTALSSAIVICLALSTAMATWAWCCWEEFRLIHVSWITADGTHLAGQKGKDLPDDSIQAFSYLCLLVHLHVETVRHLVVLEGRAELIASI
jgi:hypothetical protein